MASPNLVRIPRSACRRHSPSYAKLLRRVAPEPRTGFDFEGPFLCTGQMIPESALWPSPQFPKVPVLLEYAGNDGAAWGHRRAPAMYVLWRYQAGQWGEVARASAYTDEWCFVLGPVAAQLVGGQFPAAEASGLAERIQRFLDAELGGAPRAERWKALAIVHDQLAARLLREQARRPPAAALERKPASPAWAGPASWPGSEEQVPATG